MAIVEGSNWLYIGEVNSNDEPHGKGDMRFRSGDHYTGSFKDGYREGYGVYTFAKGEVLCYEGYYHLGKREGQGVIRYRNGDRFDGWFKEGKKHGWGTFYKHIDGYREESHYGQYHMGLKFGRFTKTDKDHRQSYYYEHEWTEPSAGTTVVTAPPLKTLASAQASAREYAKKLNPCDRKSAGIDKDDYYEGPVSALGKPHGKGRYRYSNGDVYSGEFSFGRLNGKGTYTYARGAYFEGSFKDGLWDGEGYYSSVRYGCVAGKYETGVFVKGVWRMGVITSGEVKYKKTDDDYYLTEKYVGELAPGTYMAHGQGVYTEKDGSRYEGEFKQGKRHGYGVYTNVHDGSTYRGYWEDGMRHGYGELTYRQESDYYGKKNKKGQWKNDVFVRPM